MNKLIQTLDQEAVEIVRIQISQKYVGRVFIEAKQFTDTDKPQSILTATLYRRRSFSNFGSNLTNNIIK